MDPIILFALLGAAGIWLAYSAMVSPPRVKLGAPDQGMLKRLQRQLDAAELPITANEFITSSTGLAGGLAGISLLLSAPVLAVAGLIIAPVAIWQRYEGRRDNFRQAYDEALAESVQLLREGFSATGSLRDALEHVSRNGPDPAVADFRDVFAAMATGASLEDSFAPILERRNNPYLRMVAEALVLKTSEGGNVGEVMRGLETMIREQTQLKREIMAKQSMARLESTIVSSAPIFFFLMMKVVSWMREYEQGFYRTLLGQIILAGALVFSLLSYVMSRRISTRGLTMEVEETAPPLASATEGVIA